MIDVFWVFFWLIFGVVLPIFEIYVILHQAKETKKLNQQIKRVNGILER